MDSAENAAVTTEALSAVPVPRRAEESAERAVPAPDPVLHPGAAADALPTASGGEVAEPDLAEIPARATASMRALRFDIDLPEQGN